VNLGQGGYGLDQIYLRYRRDGALIDHQLVLLAFIADDIRRMQANSFYGYGKPRLELNADQQLVIRNVPVPKRRFYAPWLTATLQHVGMLRTTEFIAKVGQRLSIGGARRASSAAIPDNTRQLAGQVFRAQNAIARDRSAKLVLIYLPTPDDYVPSDTSRTWEAFIEGVAAELDVPLINVIAEHRKLAREEAARLFGPHRHYSIEGNAYVARVIYRKLTASADLLARASTETVVSRLSGSAGRTGAFTARAPCRRRLLGAATAASREEVGPVTVSSHTAACWPQLPYQNPN
jgi:hypothetical protein